MFLLEGLIKYFTRCFCERVVKENGIVVVGRSFLKWIGGKSLLAKSIVAIMPRHSCYVEVFGGAGWVLFKKRPSKVEVYNDIDGDLVNLFRVVRDNFDEFIKRQEFLLSSREEFRRFKEKFKNRDFKDDIERAVVFYYLVKNSVNAKLDSYDCSRFKATGYCNSLDSLYLVKDRLRKVYIENLHFEKLIPLYDSVETLFYCDPPYWGSKHHSFNMKESEHILLKDILSGIKGKFVLSYNDVAEVRELYQNYNIYQTKPVKYSSSCFSVNGLIFKTELVITNYQIPDDALLAGELTPLQIKILKEGEFLNTLFGSN